MTRDFIREREVATAAVKEAMELAHRMQEKISPLDVIEKEDGSPVTVVDLAIQVIINKHLKEAFPEDEIMGEERGTYLELPEHKIVKERVLKFFSPKLESRALELLDCGRSEGGGGKRFWVIDPIDGTQGFIRREQYAIAVGLIEDGEVKLGILGCPRLGGGELFVAVRGAGCRKSALFSKKEELLHVSGTERSGFLKYCEPHGSSRSHAHEEALRIVESLSQRHESIQMDSQCRYALVAEGGADIYLRVPTKRLYIEKIWDHAPGALVVEESGGCVTDLWGVPLDFTQGEDLSRNLGVIASNGLFHGDIVAAARSILGK